MAARWANSSIVFLIEAVFCKQCRRGLPFLQCLPGLQTLFLFSPAVQGNVNFLCPLIKLLAMLSNGFFQRLDKLLAKYLNLAGKSFIYKMLRKKNITLNGKKCDGSEKLSEGDEVKLFLSDETIEKFSEVKIQKVRKRKLDVVYEDDDIILINKPSGMLSQKAKETDESLVEYLIQNGADINYHKPDMVFPYASTPVTEAARHNDFSMVRWLVEQGADITIPDKYGDRPYTVAVQNKNQEMAAYLKALEPEEWHNEQEKARQLMPYKLPAKLVEYLKTGPLRLEFPERELVKWAELYPYMDVQEMTWKRKKLLSLMAKMDNYSDYLLLWSPRDKKLWYLDIEHKEFHPLAKWEEFIADPGKYLNGMIEGEFEE